MSENQTTLIKVHAEQQLMKVETFWDVLRTSVVPKDFTNEQTMVFLATANALNLNPLNGEIYPAIMDGRVTSLVGIDGWLKRANAHPQMDGMDVSLNEAGDECTVTIYRKDRAHPTRITEYLSECKKNTRPWSTHEKRMLRHRGIIQAIRVAFGAEGAVDADDKHYFAAEGEVVGTPVTEDTQSRVSELGKAIGEAVGEPEPPQFARKPKTSCNEEGCRKLLVRFCEDCGRDFCADHYALEADMCQICFLEQDGQSLSDQVEEAEFVDQGEGIESGEDKPSPNVEPDPDMDKYPNNPGKDPMEETRKAQEPETLPWD